MSIINILLESVCKLASQPNELITRSAKFLFALAMGMFFCASLAQERPAEAWWINVIFTPSETSYRSLSIKNINPEWIKMSVLNEVSLPPDARADLEWMHREGFVFQADNYFKRRGKSDRALC